jgi:long-chain acyl-CoA synthetase
MPASRPWYGAWPADVPRSIEYPRVPAWWLVERNLPRFAGRVAIQELDSETLAEGRRLTYADLWRAVRGVASGLSEHDLGQGLRVGLCLPDGAALIVAFYATWYAGGRVVPANPAASRDELARQLGDADVTLVVGAAATVARHVAEELAVPFIDVVALRAMEALPLGGPGDYRSDQDIAVILYGGGTRTVPEAVMLTHRNVVAAALQRARWYALVPGEEVVLCGSPMFLHAGMSAGMNAPLSAGAKLLVVPERAASAAAGAVGPASEH